MKLKIIFSLLFVLMTVQMSYASFPVPRTASADTEITNTESSDIILESPAASAAVGDDLLVSMLLWFFLGWAAGHRWYLGSPVGWNILFIVTAGGLGIWWLVDGIQILSGTY